MILDFTKMNGAGSDFILADNRAGTISLTPAQVAHLCHRQRGIGADGLMVLVPCKSGKADWAWEFWNSDGSRAEMCGNGARCFARYIQRLTGAKLGRRRQQVAAEVAAEQAIEEIDEPVDDEQPRQREVPVARQGEARGFLRDEMSRLRGALRTATPSICGSPLLSTPAGMARPRSACSTSRFSGKALRWWYWFISRSSPSGVRIRPIASALNCSAARVRAQNGW